VRATNLQRKLIGAGVATVLVALATGAALSAQDKYTVKVEFSARR
jgi:hypothetical protein